MQRADCTLIIVAAGSGQRAGSGRPKQFLELGGAPVYQWSLRAGLSAPEIDTVILVVPQGYEDDVKSEITWAERTEVIAGGPSRSASVRNALRTLDRAPPRYVMIHDAARPGLSAEVIAELRSALETSEAAAPALPVVDALKQQTGASELRTHPREGLLRIQTPQAFNFALIRAAYETAAETDFVDDLGMVESLPVRVRLTQGRQDLMKLTYPEDFPMIARLIAAPEFRIGQGFDVHAFEAGDGVTLCGIFIPFDRRLKGHSDADAAWHALTDAILGAASLGDIGDHFPPSDPRWKGEPSVTFLNAAVRLAAEKGLSPVNADITLICEQPKISPHRKAMAEATAKVLGIGVDRVSVKATTTEELGFTGRREGLAAQAVVLMSR